MTNSVRLGLTARLREVSLRPMHAFNSEGKVLNAGRLAQDDWQQAFAIADVEQQQHGGGDSAVWVLDDGGGYWLLRASTRERENVPFDRLPPAVKRLVVI